MKRALARLTAAVLILVPAAAWAGPFDEYQVIMWQERPPLQTSGLARLGFTGTKLRGTGGVIEPAALALRVAAVLPWYVENIATDLFAPYHRYTEGKSVTWLFDAAKAKRRADPSDISVFVREPSLSDPVWLATVSDRLEAVVRALSQYRPLFYNLADEAGIGDLTAAWDADIGPASLAGMREWLQRQYPGLPALNRQWGTDFPDWDSVMPELTDAAMRRTDDNYSAWADFKAWMDVAFARAVRHGTEAVHRADPTALAALEGAQSPGWGGYDYARLASTVDLMEIYDQGNSLDLALAFNPALIPLRTSFGYGPREHHAVWRNLLHGGRGMVVWDERDEVVRADGSPGPRGLDIKALMTGIRAMAPLVIASEPALDPVAVLVSQASFRTRWMLDHRPGGAAWSDRDAAREGEDNAWGASRREVLESLAGIAIQPRLLSSAMVEGGALRQGGLRVLILPHAIALSAAEAEQIRAFAARGGTVLADTPPGLFDEHSRRVPAPLLAGVVQLPEAMQRTGAPLNPGHLAGVAGVLDAAGVRPRARLLGPDGAPASGVEARWLRHGSTTILSLQSLTPWGAPGQIEVRLANPAMVGDLRAPGPARRVQAFPVKLDPIEPTILSLESSP